jgi:hypothetical protein
MASDKTPLLRPSSAPVSAEEEESYFLRRFAPLWCRRKAVQLTALAAGAGLSAAVADLRDRLSAPFSAAAGGGGGGAPGAPESVRALWAATLGDALPVPPPVSERWGLLGFQGRDPSSDIRGGTAATALALALAAVRAEPALRREALLSAIGAAPPFALAVFSCVQLLACHLQLLPGGAPPPFCPCCGAAIRAREYGILAAQSHRGESLRGFLDVLREAGAGAAGEGERAHLLAVVAGGGTGSGGGGAPPGDVALGELLTLLLLKLGDAWRAQGRQTLDAAESEEALRARVRAAAAPGGSVPGDARLVNFPAALAEARGVLMAALARASWAGGGAAWAVAPPQRRASLEGLRSPGGGSHAPHVRSAMSFAGGGPAMVSPLNVLRGEGKEPEHGWGGAARRALRTALKK